MRYSSITFNGKSINKSQVNDLLLNNNLEWLIDSEIENADIEIKNNTLLWSNGIFYSGTWEYGIFKSGTFYGTWVNGIFEGGNFKGTWLSGINKLK